MTTCEAIARTRQMITRALRRTRSLSRTIRTSGHRMENCIMTARYQKWVSGEGSPAAAK